MKKLFFTAAIISLFLVNNSYSQTNATVAVSATAVSALSATGSPVSFGNISANTISYLKATGDDDNTKSNANLGVVNNEGSVSITGSSTASVEVSWSSTATLTAQGATENIATFTPVVTNGSTIINSGTTINLIDDGSNTDIGALVLYVGGQLSAATPGTYSTSNGGTSSPVTFTLQYN